MKERHEGWINQLEYGPMENPVCDVEGCRSESCYLSDGGDYSICEDHYYEFKQYQRSQE